MTTETITALMIAPKLQPIVVELYRDTDFLRSAVNLCIDEQCPVSVMQLSDTAGILYNDNISIYNAICNRCVGHKILVGVFYIVGLDHGELASLPGPDIETYKARFWDPEEFTEDEKVDAFLDWCG